MKNIFIASQFEADFFLDDFKQVDNNIYEKDCRIIVTGTGLVNTAISCTKFFSEYGVSEEDKYINAGIAGAVNPKLKIYEIVEPKHFSVFTAAHTPKSSQNILDLSYPEIGDGKVRLASSPVPVWGEKSIISLQKKNIDLIDMEAYAFVKTCLEFEAPYKIIKAVSDHLIKGSQEEFLKNAEKAISNLRCFLKGIL